MNLMRIKKWTSNAFAHSKEILTIEIGIELIEKDRERRRQNKQWISGLWLEMNSHLLIMKEYGTLI